MFYLLKPFPLSWSAERLQKLEALVERMERVEAYFEGHVRRACFYALTFGQYLGLGEKELRNLYLSAFFHDVGKIRIPSEIIQKSGPLTPGESKLMEAHSSFGEGICLDLGHLEEIAPIVGGHHEKLDGTGYPRGLKGKEIPFLTRILAIIEIYDALRSERCYKEAFSLEKSFEILYSRAVAGQLDSTIVRDLARFIGQKAIDPQTITPDLFSENGIVALHASPSRATIDPPAEVKPHTAPMDSADETKLLTILVAEDHDDQREVAELVLRKSGYRVVSADDGEQAMELIAKEQVDIALLDINMPKISGLDLCRKIRANNKLKDIYVIFLTALAHGAERVKGLELGADDYITKPYYHPELLARISVGARLIYQRREIEHRAAHDSLTGLYNRRTFEERLSDEFDRATRYQHPLSLLMIDIDDFKQVNDTDGHDWGDAVLKRITEVLRRITRKSDIPVRYGGEEFVLILPEINLADAFQVGEKICQAVKAEVFNREPPSPSFSVTVSIGAASTSAKKYQDGQAALKDADLALYRAKRKGKDRVEFIDD